LSGKPAFVDRRQVRRSFARAAADYDRHDFLVREIDRRMQERLDYVRINPRLIVDVGCSRGGSLPGLRQRYGNASVLGVDVVPAMLQAARLVSPGWRRWLAALPGVAAEPKLAAADALALPLGQESAGLVWSNLLLHWLDDPLPALAEAHRVLEVGGLLMFSAFGPDTFKELRAAFTDGYAHTQRFIDMHDLGDMLVGCGFADPVMDMEVLTLTYDSFDHLLAELRNSGGRCAMQARRHGLAGRTGWQAARLAYEKLALDDKLPVTIEVVYGHAWKTAPRTAPDGRAIVRFMERK